jgi:hypothetical protein
MNKKNISELEVMVQLGIPTGPTNPTTPKANQIDGVNRAYLFYNKTLGGLQIWNGTAWVSFAGTVTSGNTVKAVKSTTAADGTATAFAFPDNILAGTEEIYVAGLLKDRTTDYAVATNTVTFTVAPTNGQKVLGSYQKA